jgi:hypothetical protein
MAMGAVKTLFSLGKFQRTEARPGKQELIRGKLLEVWRVDQRKRTLTVYYSGRSNSLVEDRNLTTPWIPNFSLRVAEVFGA